MNDDFDETSEPELTEDEEALLQEMPALDGVGLTRRSFLGQTIAGSLGFFALDLLARRSGPFNPIKNFSTRSPWLSSSPRRMSKPGTRRAS